MCIGKPPQLHRRLFCLKIIQPSILTLNPYCLILIPAPMPALYRIYRPQTFADLIAQNAVSQTLRNEVAQGKCGQAFLFSGPRGVGKTSTARILAKAVNCTGRKADEGEPCNRCEACLEITANRSMDIIEIDAASHTGVEMVREVIIETARLSPARLKFKVFIIDEAHMLSDPAWNALLKILEEPPSHVMFILATTEFHEVPATILSRCQRFDFKRLSVADLIGRLQDILKKEKRKVDDEAIIRIARLADGSVRDAESILEQILTLEGKAISLEQASVLLPKSSLGAALGFLEAVFGGDARAGIESLDLQVNDGVDLSQFSRDCLELVRQAILVKAGAVEKDLFREIFGENIDSRISALSARVSMQAMVDGAGILVRAMQEMKAAPIIQLPLELAAIEISEGNVPVGSTSATGGGDGGKHPKDTAPAPKIKEAPKTDPVQKIESAPAAEPAGPTLAVHDAEEPEGEELSGSERVMEGGSFSSSLESVREKWGAFVQAVQQENNSLPFLLKLAEPLSVDRGTLRIGVGYAFHRDKLNELKNRLLLEKILEKEFNGRVRLETVLQEQNIAQDEALNNVLKAFGGKIVS